jgi:hypothetical protein
MPILKSFQTLALSLTLALCITNLPAFRVPVHAEPYCVPDGFCVDCQFGGGWYKEGDRIRYGGHEYVCDGETGKWIMEFAVGPTPPISVAPIGAVAH